MIINDLQISFLLGMIFGGFVTLLGVAYGFYKEYHFSKEV